MARRAKRNGGREPLGLGGIAALAASAIGLITVIWLAWSPCEAGVCFEQPRDSVLAEEAQPLPNGQRSERRRARAANAPIAGTATTAGSATVAEAATEPVEIARVEASPPPAGQPADAAASNDAAAPATEVPASDASAGAAVDSRDDDERNAEASESAGTPPAQPRAAQSEPQGKNIEVAAASPPAEEAAAPAETAEEPGEPSKVEAVNTKASGAPDAKAAADPAKAAATAKGSDATAKVDAAQNESALASEVKKSENAAAAAEAAARKAESAVAAARKPEAVAMAAAPPANSKDLSGIWELNNAIDTTTYLPYLGLRVGYRVRLQQQGSRLVGTGEKFSENGRMLPPNERTPIVLEGAIEGQTVKLNFTERYKGGSTGGTMSWQTAPSGRYNGRFSSNAAKSSGISSARRVTSSR